MMRTLDEAVQQFLYHPATPTSAMQHARIRDLFVAFVHSVWDQIPDGPEKTVALRKLQESAMYANLAVALQAPADTSDTRSVARILPDMIKVGLIEAELTFTDSAGRAPGDPAWCGEGCIHVDDVPEPGCDRADFHRCCKAGEAPQDGDDVQGFERRRRGDF